MIGDGSDRAKLEEIYLRPEFERARIRGDGALEWLRRAREWFDLLFESQGAETYSHVARFGVLLIAALIAVWAVLRLLRAREQTRVTPVLPSPTSPLQLQTPATHLGRARGLLNADPRAALREGLLALLSMLEQRRLARPDRVKTNRELARELPTRGAGVELTTTVEQLLAWYDRTFYSMAPVASAEAARFLDDIERLK